MWKRISEPVPMAGFFVPQGTQYLILFQIPDTWSKHLKKLKILRTKREKEIIKYNNLYYVLIYIYIFFYFPRIEFIQ